MRVRAVFMECRDGTSEKFYCGYTCNGRGLVHWGRVGSKGQSQLVDQAEVYKRIGEKRQKYRLIWDGFFDFDREWNQMELGRALLSAMYNGTGRALVNTDLNNESHGRAVFVW